MAKETTKKTSTTEQKEISSELERIQPSNVVSGEFSFFNPEQFAVMQRVANMFAASELVPDIYKAKDKDSAASAVANCIIAIDIANRIGANILMVMQNLTIIYGKPSWSSKFLIGTVNTCGRFNPLKFKFTSLGTIQNVEFTSYEWKGNKKEAVKSVVKGPIENIQCIAYTTAKNDPSMLEGSPITMELAIKEGWYSKNGSKWQTMPKQMLMYRAASFWTNAYAPELSLGMKTEEEVRDIVDADFQDISEETKIETEIEQNANKEVIDIESEETGPQPPEPENDNLFAEKWESPIAVIAMIESYKDKSLKVFDKFLSDNANRLSSFSGKDGEAIERAGKAVRKHILDKSGI